ncbi:hypothetical protein ACWF94_35335 [Streptomyces sp. NPDC055078]
MPRHESAHRTTGRGAGDPDRTERRASGRCGTGRRELLHDFRPGSLVAGLTAILTALLFAGDAADSWQTPWFVVFPVVFGGLFLAGAVSIGHYSLRRRAAIRASTESTGAPASTSGSHAIR